MPFTVKIRPDLGIVFTRYSGFVGETELLSALKATLENPDYNRGMIEVTDLSGVVDTNMDFRKMMAHRSRMLGYYENSGRATEHFVCAPTDLSYAVARIYVTLAQNGLPDLSLRLFRSEAETLEAMGRPETSFSELFEE